MRGSGSSQFSSSSSSFSSNMSNYFYTLDRRHVQDLIDFRKNNTESRVRGILIIGAAGQKSSNVQSSTLSQFQKKT